MSSHIEIAGRRIGPQEPAYIIAELGGNHHKDFALAVKMIEAAAECGADAVKLQHFTAGGITLESDTPWFQLDGMTMFEAYRDFETPWEWTADLKEKAESLGLALFSSPFDLSAVEFLDKLDVPAFKIASFEMVDLPLLKAVAETGKPVIMSTGMGALGEIEEAVATLRSHGCDQIVLLKCTSTYPASPEEANLRTIPVLRDLFGCPSGLSDHTMGIALPVASIALGASVIEKHFMLDRSGGGPESGFALEPAELKQLVESVRMAEKSLGTVHFGPEEHEVASLRFRRSLFVAQDMAEGEEFTAENLRSVRPSDGLHTRHYAEVLGSKATRPIQKGTPLSRDMVR